MHLTCRVSCYQFLTVSRSQPCTERTLVSESRRCVEWEMRFLWEPVFPAGPLCSQPEWPGEGLKTLRGEGRFANPQYFGRKKNLDFLRNLKLFPRLDIDCPIAFRWSAFSLHWRYIPAPSPDWRYRVDQKNIVTLLSSWIFQFSPWYVAQMAFHLISRDPAPTCFPIGMQ